MIAHGVPARKEFDGVSAWRVCAAARGSRRPLGVCYGPGSSRLGVVHYPSSERRPSRCSRVYTLLSRRRRELRRQHPRHRKSRKRGRKALSCMLASWMGSMHPSVLRGSAPREVQSSLAPWSAELAWSLGALFQWSLGASGESS